jgi:Flp pilus assembly protein TadG
MRDPGRCSAPEIGSGLVDRLWNRMRGTFIEIAAWGRRFRRSRRGSVAIMIALALPVIIGMVALGTEIAFLLFKQRQMQLVADAAALGGATALQSGHPAFGTEARGISGFLGFVDGGAAGATVTVNNPPLTGPQVSNDGAVEVIISQPQTLSMVSLFRSGLFSVGARAVATAGAGSVCILQLGSGSTGFSMSNGAVANLTGCGLAVDSTNQAALSLSGGAVLNAQSVSVAGSASINNGAAINPSGVLKTSQPAVSDPYASTAMPSYSGCGGGNGKSYGFGNWTLNPGVYCNGVSFSNAANVTMNPGVYFIDRGNFNVGGGAQLTGTGVTIVLTSSTGSNYANLTIGNGATVTLSAPTSGATAGILFFGDRNAPQGNTSSVGGGVTPTLTGALYFPSQTMIFQNGASNPSGCTQLIAGTIQLTGGSKFQNNCPTGVSAIGGSNSALVE